MENSNKNVRQYSELKFLQTVYRKKIEIAKKILPSGLWNKK